MSDQPFGSPPNPARALASVAAAVRSVFALDEPVAGPRARLRSLDPNLPDVEISLVHERRLFSRTLPLVVQAAVEAAGPDHPVTLKLRRRRLRRAWAMEATEPGSSDASAWAGRFETAGLLEGASTMTGVQDLRLSWDPAAGAWRLRLQTLAGALIGTAPSSAIAVDLEPEDVEGLLEILRAFRRAALSPP